MTNEERREYVLSFMRRHRLCDAEMATLIDRDRYWVSRARNNYSRTGNNKGDFRIPRLVTDYLKLVDMLPASVRSRVLNGDIPSTEYSIELVSLSHEEIAKHQGHLDATGRLLLERFASILQGSTVPVLKRAANQLLSLEITKNRSASEPMEPAE